MAEDGVVAAPLLRKPDVHQIGRGEGEQQDVGVKPDVEHTLAPEKIAKDGVAEPENGGGGAEAKVLGEALVVEIDHGADRIAQHG